MFYDKLDAVIMGTAFGAAGIAWVAVGIALGAIIFESAQRLG